MLFQFWAGVEDGGPTFKQHWPMSRACWELSAGEQGKHPSPATRPLFWKIN